MSYELAIIGAGVMAEAIARGIISAGTLKANQIIAADVSEQRRELFQLQLGIKAVQGGSEAVSGAGIVLLCVKPYQMEAVLRDLSPAVGEKSLVISIAAGIGTGFIEHALGESGKWRVIRAMPNTPVLVGCGMVAIARGANASSGDLATARKLFESGAKVLETTEDKMDAVTAISGSGPAYFFFLTEQMIQAGVDMGLSADEARTLAIQTAAGAAKMMGLSSDAPQEHRRRVTTPNGTTHAAISHMESQQWPKITVDALKAAAKRSAEMGK
ncbi:MAG TPA: pyrroline-5-carboxylate reductase [Tepidisphaeraceae bacterium]|jgi:pyrroline-5-carboxylate reductase|nr:pyrroline-5-carboxylate reductase [Tepidisphaeraceae bacterium]